MGDHEQHEDLDILSQIKNRRKNRDIYRWRGPKLHVMRDLYQDFQEWVSQEAKDLLMLIELLKGWNNQQIREQTDRFEKQIKEIQKTFMRKVINPMKKMAEGNSGTKSDEEHCSKFMSMLDNVFHLIIRMLQIRESLDIIFSTWKSSLLQRDIPSYII